MSSKRQSWTDLSDSQGQRPGMFDYLAPEDVDPRYGGGTPERTEPPHFRFAVIGAGVRTTIRRLRKNG